MRRSDRLSGFCCHGCRGAFALISELGLTYFYELQERLDEHSIPTSNHASSYHFFDDPHFSQSFVTQAANGLSRAVFYLPGIHCAACVWLLEKLPEVVPEFLKLRVDLARSRITVWFNPERSKLSLIAKTLAGLGYAPHPLSADHHSEPAIDKTLAIQLGVAAFCALNVMMLFVARYQGLFTGIEAQYERFFAWISLALATPAVTISALPFYRAALMGLRMRQLHIDLPIVIAIVGGFVASTINLSMGRSEIYYDTVTTLVFLLLVGRWFQARALKRVSHAADLMYALTPLSAHRVHVDGTNREVFIRALRCGDQVAVGHHDRFPCDGTVVSGHGSMNNALLTGEACGVPLEPGSPVWAGAVNEGETVIAQVGALGENSRLGKLLNEAQLSSSRSSRMAKFVDRASGYFVAGVLVLASGTFLACFSLGFWEAWDRVMALLVVSCPCALGIATPIALSISSARAGRSGILLRDGEALERLANIRHLCFDKTGTLTFGALSVVDRWGSAEPRTLGVIAGLEQGIEHPVVEAFAREALAWKLVPQVISERVIVNGKGVRGVTNNGEQVAIGSITWLTAGGVSCSPALRRWLDVHLIQQHSLVGFSCNGAVTAAFALGDRVRPEARSVIGALKERSIASSIVSGDMDEVVCAVARSIGVARGAARGGLAPEEKASLIEHHDGPIAFVGDGVNDALAISRAAVGIAISGGAEACLSVSDICLLRPDLSLLITAIDGARRTVRLIRSHLAISLVYNLTAATLAISGEIGPLAAALVMPMSSLSVILSSLWRAPFGEVP